MTKAKVSKSTKKLYSSRRKAMKGLFIKDKIGEITVSYKYTSSGSMGESNKGGSYWNRNYSNKETVVITNGLVHGYLFEGDSYYSPGRKCTLKELLEVFDNIKNFQDVVIKVSLSADYKSGEYTRTQFTTNQMDQSECLVKIKEIAKEGVDSEKTSVTIHKLTFKRPLTEKEAEAVAKIDAADIAAEEAEKKRKVREQAAIKKRSEKREAERLEREARLAQAEKDAKRREKIMKDQGELAYALAILESKGLNVVVLKDGKNVI